jgi:hypothetical protein
VFFSHIAPLTNLFANTATKILRRKITLLDSQTLNPSRKTKQKLVTQKLSYASNCLQSAWKENPDQMLPLARSRQAFKEGPRYYFCY